MLRLVSEGPPRWASRKADQYVFAKPAGNIVELKCPAEGIPEPEISWLRNGEPFEKRYMGNVSHLLFEYIMTLVTYNNERNKDEAVIHMYDFYIRRRN